MVVLAISNGKLFCRESTDATCWSVAIRDLVMVAEYSTPGGPDVDNYFLIFVTREGEEFFYLQVTGCAGGIPEAFDYLESRLGGRFELKLHPSVTWASRVIWPRALEGTAFYEFEEVEPGTIGERVRAALKGKKVTQRLSDPVMRFLSELAPPAKANFP